MKKLLCLALALVLAMSIFAGCGKTEENTPDTPATEETGKAAESNGKAEQDKQPSEEGKKDEADKAPDLSQPAPSTNKEVVTEEENICGIPWLSISRRVSVSLVKRLIISPCE